MYYAYIGTFTKPNQSQGIYRADFDATNGKLGAAELVAKIGNPTFLAIHPNQKWLYAATRESNELTGVVGFEIGRDGNLSQLGSIAATPPGPCHLSVDQTGKCLLVACYNGGSVTSHPIAADGSVEKAVSVIRHPPVSPPSERQLPPRAHFIDVDRKSRIALVADAGIDKIMLYHLDAEQARLTPHEPPFVTVASESAPRHFAFHPNGKFAYVIGEKSNTVMAFKYDEASGILSQFQELSTLPTDFDAPNTTAEIEVHPNGRFLYVSNRGHNSIAIFEVSVDGKLQALGQVPSGGKVPRHFAIDPSGNYLLSENQDTNNIVLFQINQMTGMISAIDESIAVGAPVCIQFVPQKAR